MRKDLPEWQLLNTAAHIAGYFCNSLGNNFSTGPSFITADGIEIPRNTQYGIAILRADAKDLRRVTRKAKQLIYNGWDLLARWSNCWMMKSYKMLCHKKTLAKLSI